MPDLSVLWLTKRNATGTADAVDYIVRILAEGRETDAEGHEIFKGRRVAGDVDYYYVDCSRQEEGDPVGDVNHDLLATDYRQMRTKPFRDSTYRYKATREGRAIMCEDMEILCQRREKRGEKRGRERGRREGALERAKAIAKAMLAEGEPLEKIARYFGLSVGEVEALATA